MSDSNSSSIKFSNDFTPAAYKYIQSTEEKDELPSIQGFAEFIGVPDENTIIAWADKLKKDEDGNLTDEYARPKFRDAVENIKSLSQALKTPEQPKTLEKKKTEKKRDAKKPQKQVIGEGKVLEVTEKEEEKKEEKLNPKQELFCQLYATDREFFGNGVESYAEAYDIDQSKPNWYRSAQVSASRLLSNVIILERINELLELGNLNDAFVDKQMSFVITQNADFGAKMAGIREYNKLKSRITEKIDHTSKGEKLNVTVVSYQDMPDE